MSACSFINFFENVLPCAIISSCAFIIFWRISCPVRLFHTVRLLGSQEYSLIFPNYLRSSHLVRIQFDGCKVHVKKSWQKGTLHHWNASEEKIELILTFKKISPSFICCHSYFNRIFAHISKSLHILQWVDSVHKGVLHCDFMFKLNPTPIISGSHCDFVFTLNATIKTCELLNRCRNFKKINMKRRFLTILCSRNFDFSCQQIWSQVHIE